MLPPPVAFSVEELNAYCAHAYVAGAQSHDSDIVGGVRGVGGFGGVGGVSGMHGVQRGERGNMA
eukprot:876571-Rhodomonas_salina.4